MKFTMTRTDEKAPITIPGNFLHLAGINGKLRLDVHPGVAVLTCSTTTQERVDAMISLLSAANELMDELIIDCGVRPSSEESCVDCACCGGRNPDEDEPLFEDCIGCEYHGECAEDIRLPLCWLEDAGLPFFGDLRAVCDDGKIVITAADAEPDETERLLNLLEMNGFELSRARELLDVA